MSAKFQPCRLRRAYLEAESLATEEGMTYIDLRHPCVFPKVFPGVARRGLSRAAEASTRRLASVLHRAGPA